MKETNITSKTPQQLTDLLMKLMRKTQQSISCAELALVDSIDNEKEVGSYRCSLINNMNIVVDCEICSHVTNVGAGTIVLIVFCDTDFRQNLSKIRRESKSTTIKSNEYHSTSYGVIVGKLD